MYPIYRPLNLLTDSMPKALAEVFIAFILSEEGQVIVAKDYITVK